MINRSEESQSTYRGRDEIGASVSALERTYTATLYLMVTIVKGGRRAPPPSPAWVDFSTMMQCTPESGRCHSVCTLCARTEWLLGYCKHRQQKELKSRVVKEWSSVYLSCTGVAGLCRLLDGLLCAQRELLYFIPPPKFPAISSLQKLKPVLCVRDPH